MAPADPDRGGRRTRLLLAILAALVFGIQGLWGSSQESQTWDEAYAIAVGYLQVARGTFDLMPENPPLMGLLIALPFRIAGAKLPDIPAERLGGMAPPDYGEAFLYHSGNDSWLLLQIARGCVLLLSAIAVAVIVMWAGMLFGLGGCLLASVLAAFEPNWLAHGHLAAWDGIATSTVVLATAGITAFARRPTLRRAILAGCLTGIAWSAKHTALILWPVLAGLLFLSSPWAGRWRMGPGHGSTAPGFWVVARQYAVVALVGLFVVGAAYNLHWRYDLYLHGITQIYRQNIPDHYNYLLGEFSTSKFPHYYLVALFAKTPAAWLPLLPMGVLALRRQREGFLWLAPAFLAALVFLASLFNPYNIGVRHVLPAMPLLLLFASGAAARLRDHAGAARVTAITALALAALGGTEVLARAPGYLSFFNVLVGGPGRGIRILDDSNIDWGQDLIALARIQKEEGIDRIALLYFGSADPVAYGVVSRPIDVEEFRRPRPGVVYAVSIHNLNRFPIVLGRDVNWLEACLPWRIAGRSIYLYRF